MKFYSRLFKNNSIKILATSSCTLSLLGVSYYLSEKQLPLHSYSINNLNDLYRDDMFKKCNQIMKRYKEQYGIPAVIVEVSQNGKTIYSNAVGFSDVENCVKATPDTVARIASISKPITCVIASKLYENGKLDLDKPINEYIEDLPAFKFQDKEYKITSRQLMTHTSGIRHYKNQDDKSNDKDTAFKEFYLNKQFKTTKDALDLFKNDPLLNEPGTIHSYTTFGYTLLSAVLEKSANNAPFSKLVEELLAKFDMRETFLDKNDDIIANRSKYYMRDKKKKLINVPSVDNSYKWAGGGLLSTVHDLLKFGNLMLTFYQAEDSENNFLKSSTMKLMWSTQSYPKNNENNLLSEANRKTTYGLGWALCHDEFNKLKYVYHTGGAVGATSCLLIVPYEKIDRNLTKKIPNGLVISVLCNSQDVSEIVKFTLSIARVFSKDQI